MSLSKRRLANAIEISQDTAIASPGDDTPCACEGNALGLPLRTDMGFKLIEELTLDVLRCVCMISVTGDNRYWEQTVEYAERHLGGGNGPEFVAHVSSLMQAIRTERQTPFSFLTPGCHHICDDELTVQTVIKAAQQAHYRIMENVLKYLTRSQSTAMIATAAKSLASAQICVDPSTMTGCGLPPSQQLPVSRRLH